MKNLFKYMKLAIATSPFFVAAFLSGCSSGGGSGNSAPPPSAVRITGTAAAGAPVIGYVSVRDSSANTQPVKTNIPIEANGNYSVDVTGLTAPYAFLASGTVGGRTVSLYSAATSADEGKTINITPFTDLIIRNVAATAVDTYINNGGYSGLTPSQLDAKRVTLTTQLTPALEAMGVGGSIDLLRATFNADNTGLDRFMDVVKVTPDPLSTNVTITNILDAANTLIIDTSTGTYTGNLSTTGLAASGTPIDGMKATTDAFSAFFATSLPSPSDPALLALFSSTFMDDGKGSSAFLTDITSSGTSIIGLKFINVVVDSVDTATGLAQIHFTPVNAAGEKLARGQVGGAIGWQMKKNAVTSIWQMNGNRRIAHVSVQTRAAKNTCNPASTACTMTTTYRTGLHFEINNEAMQPIGTALVTGPGLPAGGVTLVPQQNQTWFSITTANPNNPLCGGCNGGNDWIMSDTEIGQVTPNSDYTVKLYDNNPTAPALLATYTERVPVAPTLNTAVTGLAYPSISGMVNLAGIDVTTTLTPSWNIPAGLWGNYLDVNMWQTGTNAFLHVEASKLQASSGTASLVITPPPAGGTWTSGNYGIGASDQYGGRVDTFYQ